MRRLPCAVIGFSVLSKTCMIIRNELSEPRKLCKETPWNNTPSYLSFEVSLGITEEAFSDGVSSRQMQRKIKLEESVPFRTEIIPTSAFTLSLIISIIKPSEVISPQGLFASKGESMKWFLKRRLSGPEYRVLAFLSVYTDSGPFVLAGCVTSLLFLQFSCQIFCQFWPRLIHFLEKFSFQSKIILLLQCAFCIRHCFHVMDLQIE